MRVAVLALVARVVPSRRNVTTCPARRARRAAADAGAKSSARKPAEGDLSSRAIRCSVAATYLFHAATVSGYRWAAASEPELSSREVARAATGRVIREPPRQ